MKSNLRQQYDKINKKRFKMSEYVIWLEYKIEKLQNDVELYRKNSSLFKDENY